MSKVHRKSMLLDKLRKTPIVQVACLKIGINRVTYYRWRNTDKQFAKDADEAIKEGWEYLCDLAESRLIQAIKDGDIRAIAFWLKHHDPNYSDKVKFSGKVSAKPEPEEKLTPEQRALIEKALKLAMPPEHEADK